MKALVTGATGFVGRAVLAQLTQAGWQIRILARYPQAEPVRHLAALHRAEVSAANILDPASLTTAFANVDAAIHLVGIISELGDNTFENIHTRGTKNVVAAATAAGVKRLIHMSALGARPNAVARYHQSKWAAEEIVRASGLDWTIFRPSIIYGPGDQFVNLFANLSRRSPVMPLIAGGRSKMQPIPVADVAAAFVRALKHPDAICQCFNLAGGEILTLRRIIDTILEVTGRKRWKIPVPMWAAQLQASLMEFLWPALFLQAPPLNRDQLLMLREDNTGDPTLTNELFKLKPIKFRDGISAYLNPRREQ